EVVGGLHGGFLKRYDGGGGADRTRLAAFRHVRTSRDEFGVVILRLVHAVEDVSGHVGRLDDLEAVDVVSRNVEARRVVPLPGVDAGANVDDLLNVAGKPGVHPHLVVEVVDEILHGLEDFHHPHAPGTTL